MKKCEYGMEETTLVDKADFLAHVECALRDEFLATVTRDENGVCVEFASGQIFRLNATEVA